jgi:hypothetical protein
MACPQGTKGGNQCGCSAEIVDVDQEVADVAELFDSVARRNIAAINELGRETGGLVMEVQVSVEDEEIVASIIQSMQRAELLFKLAMDELGEAGKLSALATLEEGPAAASLQLSAASKTATAIGYLLRCGNQLQVTKAEALAAMEIVEEEEGPTAEAIPFDETAPNDDTF